MWYTIAFQIRFFFLNKKKNIGLCVSLLPSVSCLDHRVLAFWWKVVRVTSVSQAFILWCVFWGLFFFQWGGRNRLVFGFFFDLNRVCFLSHHVGTCISSYNLWLVHAAQFTSPWCILEFLKTGKHGIEPHWGGVRTLAGAPERHGQSVGDASMGLEGRRPSHWGEVSTREQTIRKCLWVRRPAPPTGTETVETRRLQITRQKPFSLPCLKLTES